jgi:SPP1 gp7 family putative phage head morphogenesis protein
MANQSIAVRFAEAIEFLKNRIALSDEQWLQILSEEGDIASAIADDATRKLMGRLIAAIVDILEEGGGLTEFRDRFDRIVEETGWFPKEGADWYTDMVFRLHTGMAFNAGRWEQALRLEEARPGSIFIRLMTAGDHRVRDSHALMHGVVLPVRHPWWQTRWPPNGFNCRCTVQILTARDLTRYGYAVTPEGDPRLLAEPDEGWAFNPGLVGMRMDVVNRASAG